MCPRVAVADFRCGGSAAVPDLCVCVLLVHAASSAAAVPMETQPLFALCVTVPNLDFHAFGSLVP